MEYQTKWKIIREIVVLKVGQNGWRKELNLVSWNGQEPKYDVRWWSPDKKYVGKGMTLTPEELFALEEILQTLPRDLHLTY